MIEIITKYFPRLSSKQKGQITALDDLYRDWNTKINVVSRKDIDNLYERHVLHSLAIAKVINFVGGTTVLDIGTGGGFPGIPLAILFPDSQFRLIDGTAKKIKVAEAVAKEIGLQNIEAVQKRAEVEYGKYDFVVSRGVMPLNDLVRLTTKNLQGESHNALPNGWLCLKGGDLTDELCPFKNIAEVIGLNQFFDEEWFSQGKKLVYIPARPNVSNK